MSEYQEEVLTGLLDLQAELRGDEPEPHDEPAAKASSEASIGDVGEGSARGTAPGARRPSPSPKRTSRSPSHPAPSHPAPSHPAHRRTASA